jgi:hypothetical protein
MSRFNIFNSSELNLTSSDLTSRNRNQTIYCNVRENVNNNLWKPNRDILIGTEVNPQTSQERKYIAKMGSYDIMHKLHKGFYSYKQDISGYCFEDGVTKGSNGTKFQLVDILYTGYTISDLEGVVYNTNNLCNVTGYYSMAQMENPNLNVFIPAKFRKIYKFPTKLYLS